MNWQGIDWDKLRKEVMLDEKAKHDDIDVAVLPHEHETNTYKVVYRVGERSDYIPTGMHAIMSAIGYAICHLENEIHEQEVSDCMPNYYKFTITELHSVMYKLSSAELQEDDWND